MNSRKDKQDRADLELSILYRISQRMAQQHDVSSLLDDVLDIMETEMGLSRGTLTLQRPDSDVLKIEASRVYQMQSVEGGNTNWGKASPGASPKVVKPLLFQTRRAIRTS